MVKAGGLTHIGKVRKLNEDCFAVGENFALVSDGMGGHNKGEVASSLVVRMLTEKLKANITKEELVKYVMEVNRAVVQKANTDFEYDGMGATLVLACWNEYKVLIANVGDSRCYHIKNSEITQITKDHSLVQMLLDNGEITENEALKSDKKHIIYRAMGGEDEAPDIFEVTASKGDIFLLCSDGLSNMLENDEILKIVGKSKNPELISEKLVKKANEKGGTDNITVATVIFD